MEPNTGNSLFYVALYLTVNSNKCVLKPISINQKYSTFLCLLLFLLNCTVTVLQYRSVENFLRHNFATKLSRFYFLFLLSCLWIGEMSILFTFQTSNFKLQPETELPDPDPKYLKVCCHWTFFNLYRNEKILDIFSHFFPRFFII